MLSQSGFLLRRIKTYSRVILFGLILISMGVSLFFTLDEMNRNQALVQVQDGFQFKFLWTISSSLILVGVMDCLAMLCARFLIGEKRTGRLFQKRS